ncbi:MAG: hypothetical protein ACI3Y0_05130 [Prevotella sp.]
MREKIRDRGRLEHIAEQLNNIEEFVANKTIKVFGRYGIIRLKKSFFKKGGVRHILEITH